LSIGRGGKLYAPPLRSARVRKQTKLNRVNHLIKTPD
jgi:hypothetical protein